MGFWATIIITMLQIAKETVPMLLKWLIERDNALGKARKRAEELQNQAATTARLIREQNAPELSRTENAKLVLLEQLFKSRRLRKTGSVRSPGKSKPLPG